jgi:hypothetical protein
VLILVPALCFILLCVVVRSQGGSLGFPDANLRMCVVLAFAFFQMYVVVVTELVSIGHHYTRPVVLLAWSAALLSLVALAVPALTDVVNGSRSLPSVRDVLALTTRTGRVDVVAGLLVLAGFFGALTVIGGLYRPSNGDSMAYHLARVEHWIQNGSVAAFPAHFLAQVELPPLMEYNLATLHLLAGTDRFDGFVQLSAVAVCVLGASELARRLGLGLRGQIVTALVVITAPNFLLQATSTTNDDFNAAMGLTALCLATAPLVEGAWMRRAVVLGLVAGLVELAKSTLFLLLGPAVLTILILAVLRLRDRYGPRVTAKRAAGTIALAAVAALVLAGPFLARNLSVFGGVGGPVSRATIDNHASLSNSTANVLRQVSAQFLIGDGTGLEYGLSRAVVRPLGWLYDRFGQDPDDTDFAFTPNPDPFRPGDFSVLSRFEDVGANPWHTLLVASSVLLLAAGAVGSRRKHFRVPLLLAVALCLGFLAFGMTVKWSIYASRYYVPLLVAWSPLIAVALSRLPRTVVRLACLALVLACLPQLLDNYQRPLMHPVAFGSALEPYFVTAGSTELMASKASDYEHLAQSIAASDCRQVGIANQVVVEYPIWVALDDAHWDGTIEHVDVKNVSARLVEHEGFRPCALIYQPDQRGFVSAHPTMRQWTFGNLVLFISVDSLR